MPAGLSTIMMAAAFLSFLMGSEVAASIIGAVAIVNEFLVTIYGGREES